MTTHKKYDALVDAVRDIVETGPHNFTLSEHTDYCSECTTLRGLLRDALAAQSEEMIIDIVVGGYDRSERAEDRLHKARARLAAQSAALEAAEAWLTSYGYDLHDQLNRHPLADVFDAARASMKEKA